mgnify:CR=1 FL=1
MNINGANGTNNKWTHERVEFMRRLRLIEGMSAGQIAKKLQALGFTGVSRSAVIGKLHRMGIEPAPKLAKERGLQIKTHTNKMRGLARALTREQKPVRPTFDAREPIQRGPNSIPFIERKSNQCPMFCEGEEGSQGFVCGEAVSFGARWCVRCHARACQPVPVKQGKAA